MSKKAKIRLYVKNKLAQGCPVQLSVEHFHYCFKVMRAKIGDSMLIFNETCGEWKVILHKNYVLPMNLERNFIAKSLENHLILGKVPNQLLKQIVRQATELDINRISIINTDFCNHTLKTNDERLQKIAIEAAEQCERLDILVIYSKFKNITDLLNNFPVNTNLIFCDEKLAQNKITAKKQFIQNNVILIGPEGGFSNREREMLNNFPQTIPIKLSDNILQVDTAVVTAINYAMQH